MAVYDISVVTRRQKVATIKLVRTTADVGLKNAKELVEAQINFDSWMEEFVVLKLRLDDASLGRLAYHCANNEGADITRAERVPFNRVDFDFRK